MTDWQTIICPTCNGEGRNTGQDDSGFYAIGICEDCEGRCVVDASCAGCDRIVPIDAEGFCTDCGATDFLSIDVKQLSNGRNGLWL